MEISQYDVCLSAKIRILKQITTVMTSGSRLKGCLSKRKDTNFKANHNASKAEAQSAVDVCLSAKIRISKQTLFPFSGKFVVVRCLAVAARGGSCGFAACGLRRRLWPCVVPSVAFCRVGGVFLPCRWCLFAGCLAMCRQPFGCGSVGRGAPCRVAAKWVLLAVAGRTR